MPQPKYFVAAERSIEDKSGLVSLINLIDELQFAAAPAQSGFYDKRIGLPIIDMVVLSKWVRSPTDGDSEVFEAKIEIRKPFQTAEEPPGLYEFTFGEKASQMYMIRVVGPLEIPTSLPEPPYEYRVKVSVRKKSSSDEWITDELAVPIKGIGDIRG